MESPNAIKRKPVAKPTEASEYEAVGTGKTEEDASSSEQPATREAPVLSKETVAMLIAVVVGCTLVIVGAIMYLTFLWFGGPARRSWKRIILSNWIATSVAICALAIRWMSGFQTTLCTSILALMLLRKGVPTSTIPRISTIRYTTSGPLDIVPLAVPSVWKQGLHLPLICLLTLVVSLVLQFSSTLLLSDLDTGLIETSANKTLGRGLTQFEGGTTVDYSIAASLYSDPFVSTTPIYPVFAEYTYPDINKPYSDHELSSYLSPWSAFIDDTEPVIRALFPVSTQENRSQLLSYDGNATLYDARWVCTPPHLEDLKLVGTWDGGGVLSGSANLSVWLPEFYDASYYPSDFACSVDYTAPSTSWTLFTCCLTADSDSSDQFDLGGIISALDYKANLSDYYYYDDLNYPQDPQSIGYTWLVINVTNFTSYSGLPAAPNVYNYTFNDSSAWSTSMGKSGPWVHITSSQLHARRAEPICSTSSGCTYDSDSLDPDNYTYAEPWSFGLDVTLCSNALSLSKNMHINAWRGQASNEPATADNGLKQLGATPEQYTIEERGLFHLNDTEMWHQLKLEREGPYGFWSNTTETLWISDLPTHSIFTPYGGGSDSGGLIMRNTSFFYGRQMYDNQSNEDLLLLMQLVIQRTGSPARALQALQHVVFTNRYYKYLYLFDAALPQAVTYQKEVLQPVRIRGYIAVMTAIGIHFLLVLYIVMIFGVLQGTRRILTSIGQAWQVFAQVSALQRELALDGEGEHCQITSTIATDHVVEGTLRHRGLKDKVFVLDDTNSVGDVGFRVKK